MDEDVLIIDARGHRCPVPTLKLQRAAKRAKVGDRLCLVCDDPMARIDVPHYATTSGLTVLAIEEAAGVLRFTVSKA